LGVSRAVKDRKHFKQRAFLAAYAATGCLRTAAEAIKIDRKRHHEWTKNDATYEKAFEAVAEDIGRDLEIEAIRRAMGAKSPMYYRGKPVKTGRGGRTVYEVEYSDQLLITLLKRFRPALYRERTTTEVTGSIDLVDRMQAARKRLIEMKRNDGSAANG